MIYEILKSGHYHTDGSIFGWSLLQENTRGLLGLSTVIERIYGATTWWNSEIVKPRNK